MEIFESGNFQINILLVDDKKENLIALEKLLEEKESTIRFLKATSGQEALRIAFFEELALILLDVQMPEMDGFEVARLLQMNNKTKNVPVIFVTASDHDTSRVVLGYETGAIDYLFKPLNPAITKAKVRSFIKMYMQRREVEILTNLVSNSLDLMCIVDAASMKILTANPAWEAMLGFKPEELKGKIFNDLIFCEIGKSGYDIIELLANNTSVANYEACVRNKSGEVKYILWSLVLKNNLWYCNGREFTDRKFAEEQLQIAQDSLKKFNNELEERVKERTEELIKKNEELLKINTDLDSFLYTASHDLKAPMSNIEGLVDALHEDCRGNEDADMLFGMIDICIGNFKHVITDLTDMAKAQSEEMSDIANIAFKDMVEEVKSGIGELIARYHPQFIEDFSKAPQLRFSRKNFKSILYNLITNAIKFSSPHRKPIVKISTIHIGEYILLSVQDNGLGIKEQDKAKVFSMFKRLHDHVEGTGMGMSLVKRIVDKSGGKVELESKLGEGSIFKIYFRSPETL